jgi:hypothetical protein
MPTANKWFDKKLAGNSQHQLLWRASSPERHDAFVCYIDSAINMMIQIGNINNRNSFPEYNSKDDVLAEDVTIYSFNLLISKIIFQTYFKALKLVKSAYLRQMMYKHNKNY